MKFFFDTEFQDHGRGRIDLISIGVVDETGHAFYRVSSEYDESGATDWLKDNVLVHITEEAVERETQSTIASELLYFVEGDKAGSGEGARDGSEIEFWAWYADYDFVVMSGLFGSLIERPKGWPMYCRDIKQYADSLGSPRIPALNYSQLPGDLAYFEMRGEQEHDALYDAVENVHRYNWLKRYEIGVSRDELHGTRVTQRPRMRGI